MEKIEFRGMWVRGDFYNAADVDALLAAARALVEAAKGLWMLECAGFYPDCNCLVCKFRKAIAAVERNLQW